VDSWECFGQTWTPRMETYFRDAAFWNCLFVGNGRKPNLFEACRLVNCTVIGNASAVFSSDTYAVNMICADNDTLNCRSDMKTCKGSVFGLPNSAGASLAGGMENVVCDETAEHARPVSRFCRRRSPCGRPVPASAVWREGGDLRQRRRVPLPVGPRWRLRFH